jgi:hypothetical protein
MAAIVAGATAAVEAVLVVDRVVEGALTGAEVVVEATAAAARMGVEVRAAAVPLRQALLPAAVPVPSVPAAAVAITNTVLPQQ